VGAWPFITLLKGYFLWKTNEKRKFVLPFIFIIKFIITIMFLRHYFFIYPKTSFQFYDASLKNAAQLAKMLDTQKNIKGVPPGMNSDDIWEKIIWKYYPQHNGAFARYFLMNYRGEGCSESRKHFLAPRGLFSSSLSAEEYNTLALQLAQQGDYEEAVKHFSAAIQRNPDYAEAHKNLGTIWDSLGYRQKALDSFTRAYEILSKDSQENPGLLREIEQLLGKSQLKAPEKNMAQ
jgi:tetratricopeptide (TPR) repeat protein